MNKTLKQEIEGVLDAFNNDMCASQGSDTPISDQKKDRDKAVQSILSTIRKHLPEKKNPEAKHLFETPNGTTIDYQFRDYIKGYNAAIDAVDDLLEEDVK